MGIRYLKILIIALAMGFVTQACAVWVHDHDHGRRFRRHHWRSSLQHSDQSMAQLSAQNTGESETHDDDSR